MFFVPITIREIFISLLPFSWLQKQRSIKVTVWFTACALSRSTEMLFNHIKSNVFQAAGLRQVKNTPPLFSCSTAEVFHHTGVCWHASRMQPKHCKQEAVSHTGYPDMAMVAIATLSCATKPPIRSESLSLGWRKVMFTTSEKHAVTSQMNSLQLEACSGHKRTVVWSLSEYLSSFILSQVLVNLYVSGTQNHILIEKWHLKMYFKKCGV